jgi:hypothetical protein
LLLMATTTIWWPLRKATVSRPLTAEVVSRRTAPGRTNRAKAANAHSRPDAWYVSAVGLPGVPNMMRPSLSPFSA